MTSILLINPNTSLRTLEMMLGIARPMLPPAATLTGVAAGVGVSMILDEAGLAVAAQEVVRLGTAAAAADVIVVAAFGDPGVDRLRGLRDGPVIGIGEAAIAEAAMGGRRFGIATTTPGLVRAIEAAVRRTAVARSFTGIRVPARDPLALAADPGEQDAALARMVLDCLRLDGAEAVVIGGGPLSESAARLRRDFDIAIIEPIPAAIRAVSNLPGAGGLRP